MRFKITTVKTITDPAERRRRLARVYRIFEKAIESAEFPGPQDSTAEAAQAKPAQHEDSTPRRRAGQNTEA